VVSIRLGVGVARQMQVCDNELTDQKTFAWAAKQVGPPRIPPRQVPPIFECSLDELAAVLFVRRNTSVVCA